MMGGKLKDTGGNLCMESVDIGNVINKYFASALTKAKDMDGSETSVGNARTV